MPQYRIAAWLILIGAGLWTMTWAWNHFVRHRDSHLRDPQAPTGHHDDAPHN